MKEQSKGWRNSVLGGLGKGGGKGEKTSHGGWSLVGLVNSMRVTDLFLCASLCGHSGVLRTVGSLALDRRQLGEPAGG